VKQAERCWSHESEIEPQECLPMRETEECQVCTTDILDDPTSELKVEVVQVLTQSLSSTMWLQCKMYKI